METIVLAILISIFSAVLFIRITTAQLEILGYISVLITKVDTFNAKVAELDDEIAQIRAFHNEEEG